MFYLYIVQIKALHGLRLEGIPLHDEEFDIKRPEVDKQIVFFLVL